MADRGMDVEPILIEATEKWKDTGATPTYDSDLTLVVEADGGWRHRPDDAYGYVDTNGDTMNMGGAQGPYRFVDGNTHFPYHAEGAKKAQLIGKWGADGQIFPVGKHIGFRGDLMKPEFKGKTLWLGINDYSPADNSGHLEVRIWLANRHRGETTVVWNGLERRWEQVTL
ncbi:hypothetical protein AB0940_33260 [Streptomyces sp. NPDC006656]|uniref:hypothetical protein n=1 Tax=Streptomyces sp. NPDC006656 TaxID=3156899 RepID=UPI003454EF83